MKIKKLMLLDPIEIKTGLQMEEDLYNEISNCEVDLGYFLWRSKKALVVPRSATRNDKFEQASEWSAQKGWPVVVRSTGGELTPQCEDFFNLSIFLRCKDKQISIKDSYMIICSAIIGWLSEMGIQGDCASIDGAFCDGDFNVNIDGKKLVGTAQRWRKVKSDATSVDEKALLLHAVILCDGEIDNLFDISNAFYEMCGVTPFIVKNRHISLGELIKLDAPNFVENKMDSFNKYMNKYIEKVSEKYYQ